jgi:hypothetical protein
MNSKQRKALTNLDTEICELTSCASRLRGQLRKFSYTFNEVNEHDNDEFTQEKIDKLVMLNQRLAKLQLYLCQVNKTESAKLDIRLDDPNDPFSDYEIEATIYFILGETDPAFDDSDDNFLTKREICLKHLEPENSLSDGFDYREIGRTFPGELNTVPHCWLFHDLYDHSYGWEQPSLTLQDCLRIDSIWVDVSVRHQSTLDINSGQWRQS